MTSQSPEVRGPFPMAFMIWGAMPALFNVGTDHDTGAFAVASIRGWWRFEGRHLYPEAENILITADGGGSNGSRLRLWKLELQGFADETGLALSVCHFPPGHQQMEQDRASALFVHFVELAGRAVAGLRNHRELDFPNHHGEGVESNLSLGSSEISHRRKVSNREMKRVNVEPNKFHGE